MSNSLIAGLGGLFFFLFFLSIILFGVYIWFFINLQSAMNTVSLKNRKIEGALVWLNLIPLFNFIWPFIFNSALSESYKKEFLTKGIDYEVSVKSGIVYPILILVSIFVPVIFYLPLLTFSPYDRDYFSYFNFFSIVSSVIYFLASIGSYISLIIFWIEVNKLKNILLITNPTSVQSYNTIENFDQNNDVSKILPSKDITPNREKNTNQTSIEKLKKYHEMLNQGLITKDDFDKIKNEILKD